MSASSNLNYPSQSPSIPCLVPSLTRSADDWMPSMALLPKRHAGRCLDFPTFCANDDADADVDAYVSAKRNPAEFEYCAPGAFM